MNWEAISAISEVVGVVAVVVSLAYVAIQIRQNTSQIDQNTKAVQAAAIDSSISHAIDTRKSLVENADVMRLWMAGSNDPEHLSEEDLYRYRLCIYNAIVSTANIYAQTRYAELAEDTWAAQIPSVRRVLTTNGGKWFWDNHGAEFEQSFQDEVARILIVEATETA